MTDDVEEEREQVLELAQCDGKDSFDTFALADQVARKTKRDKHKADIRVYRCDHCHKYHIGSNAIFRRQKAPRLTKRRR